MWMKFPAGREVERVQVDREELGERIAQIVPADGKSEPWPGLHLFRVSRPTDPQPGVLRPALCVIAQGSKHVYLGEQRLQYDPAHYLLVTVGLPIVSHVVEASPARPYLALRLDLDLVLVGEVILAAGGTSPRGPADVRGLQVSALDPRLLDALVRLVRLADKPTEAHFLAPLVTREILYRLLQGEQGDLLRRIAGQDGQTYRIARAVERLQAEYNQPLRIDAMARELGMSESGFYHHFKAVTGMSPLQFQKRQRLQEARRLLVGEQLDVTTTALRVGYEDVSHFNREYKRLFGAPPRRDAGQLRDLSRQTLNAAD
jgi:AraC-like DNA-binding protein